MQPPTPELGLTRIENAGDAAGNKTGRRYFLNAPETGIRMGQVVDELDGDEGNIVKALILWSSDGCKWEKRTVKEFLEWIKGTAHASLSSVYKTADGRLVTVARRC